MTEHTAANAAARVFADVMADHVSNRRTAWQACQHGDYARGLGTYRPFVVPTGNYATGMEQA
jgi:hypothetical protein